MKKSAQHTKTKSTKGLSNPAAVATAATLATTPAGQKTISTAVNGTGSIVKWVLIGGVLIGVSVVGYKIYKNRFVKMLQNNNFPKPTITPSVAIVKADGIYNAMFGVGANYSKVKNLLLGLNYNDFVLVYNAFGKRESAIDKANPTNWFNVFSSSGMTLTEWLTDQFTSSNQIADLRAILPNGVI